MTKQLRKLSKETAIELKDGDFVVYDTRAYSPQRVTTLTYHEVGELTLLFTEGLCPSCLRDMPEVNDVVCEHCHNAAALGRVGGGGGEEATG